MITVTGNTISFYQGEDGDVAFPVTNKAGAAVDLTGGEAVLTYKKAGETAVDLDCVIATTTVTATFAHAVTELMSGSYNFQLMCRNAAGKIVMTKAGTIQVNLSLNPNAVSV